MNYSSVLLVLRWGHSDQSSRESRMLSGYSSWEKWISGMMVHCKWELGCRGEENEPGKPDGQYDN